MRRALALVVVTLLSGAGGVSARQTTPPAAAPCAAEGFHQLDFWIGSWKIQTPDGKPAGTSIVEAVSGGCAVLERFSGTGPYRGSGLHVFSPAQNSWRQFWTDNRPATVDMQGRQTPTGFVYTWEIAGPQGEKIPKRYTLSKLPQGLVRQLGERSNDAGKTWIAEFDYTYSKV